MNKKILITLCVSLALNFFFLGFCTSRLMFKPEPARMAHFGKKHAFDAGKKEFFKPSPKERRAFHKKMKEIDALHKKISKAMSADPFDEKGARKAWDKAAAVRGAMDADMRDAVIEKMKKLPADERARLVREFDGFFKKGLRHGQDKHETGCRRHDGAFKVELPFMRIEGRPALRRPDALCAAHALKGAFEHRSFDKPCGCHHKAFEHRPFDKPCGCHHKPFVKPFDGANKPFDKEKPAGCQKHLAAPAPDGQIAPAPAAEIVILTDVNADAPQPPKAPVKKPAKR